jgi:predicted nucleic acid-binding protein
LVDTNVLIDYLRAGLHAGYEALVESGRADRGGRRLNAAATSRAA